MKFMKTTISFFWLAFKYYQASYIIFVRVLFDLSTMI